MLHANLGCRISECGSSRHILDAIAKSKEFEKCERLKQISGNCTLVFKAGRMNQVVLAGLGVENGTEGGEDGGPPRSLI